MDSVVLASLLSPAELGTLALICVTLVAPIVFALVLERFVYEGKAADPVGFTEFESRFENGETWTDQLHEDRDD